jgi:Carbohydrate esterase, sialic acid-specific acetylesterase
MPTPALSFPLVALCLFVVAAPLPAQSTGHAGKVEVFVLAGQSNMEGKGRVKLAEYQSEAPAFRDWYRDLKPGGHWVVRHDVWIDFLDRHGELTVGFGSPGCIGPELGFGMVVGDHFEQQVLLIKTAWGGKSLGRDFLPPSAKQPTDEELQAIVARENIDNAKKHRPLVDLAAVRARYGEYYRDMLHGVRTTLAELPKRFPGYHGQGYEFAGFVWFQGWNDQYDEGYISHYGDNLACLVRDVRKDLHCPHLPVVVGIMGQNGLQPAKGAMARIKAAQAAIAEQPEFKGNVASVATDVFWDRDAAALIDGWEKHKEAWEKVGSDRGYHYLGSVRTFTDIGRALGKAMLQSIAAK